VSKGRGGGKGKGMLTAVTAGLDTVVDVFAFESFDAVEDEAREVGIELFF